MKGKFKFVNYRFKKKMEIINRETKVCATCGKELPISEFSPQPANRDGHLGSCKKCRAEANRKRKEDKDDFYMF